MVELGYDFFGGLFLSGDVLGCGGFSFSTFTRGDTLGAGSEDQGFEFFFIEVGDCLTCELVEWDFREEMLEMVLGFHGLELEVEVGEHVSEAFVVFLLDFWGRGHRKLELCGLHKLVEEQSADGVDRPVDREAKFEVVEVLSAGVEADFTEGASALELVWGLGFWTGARVHRIVNEPSGLGISSTLG